MTNYMLPRGSAIEWSDVFRLAANNAVGRRLYQKFINEHDDAGHCLEAIINELLNPATYIMANRYEFGLTGDEFDAAVNTLARGVAEKRNKEDEPFEYWRLVIGNCRRLMAEAMAL